MQEALVPGPTQEILDLQEANKRIIESYLALKGPDCIDERLAFFTKDGMREIVSTKSGLPERTVGQKALHTKMERLRRKWMDFSYSNISIYKTPDPDRLIVECDGEGLIKNPMFTQPHHYENHFFMIFLMREGKIKSVREFMNPMKLDYAFWNPMPDKTM